MSDSTNQLIANLSSDAARVKPVRMCWLCARWMGGFVLYSLVLANYTGTRPDIHAAMAHPLFLVELGVLVALILSSALTAALLSFPDHYQYRKLLWLPVPLSVALFVTLLAEWLTSPPGIPLTGHGAECLTCISLYALLPGGVLFTRMRKLASTQGPLAGAAAVIASFSTGALALRLQEPTDDIAHLLQWHYLPMLGIAILGLALGKWLLKW